MTRLQGNEHSHKMQLQEEYKNFATEVKGNQLRIISMFETLITKHDESHAFNKKAELKMDTNSHNISVNSKRIEFLEENHGKRLKCLEEKLKTLTEK